MSRPQKRVRLYRRPQDERVERRRATRAARGRGGTQHARLVGPAEIPSEARMLANLEAAWGASEPGAGGRILDADVRADADVYDDVE